MINVMLDALKALRDAAAAKLAASPDNTPTITIAKGAEVIPLKPKRVKPVAHDDAPEPPVSMPLLHTASWHTATSISSEFDGDMRFDDAATRQWRADQQRQWRDSNRDLKRQQP
jgi:hypothetical protein